MIKSNGRGELRGWLAEVGRNVEDPPQLQAMVTTCRLAGVLDRFQEGLRWQVIADRGVRGHCEFGVTDVLGRHVGRDLVGDQPHILGSFDQVDDREIVPDEVGEVGEDEESREFLGIARNSSWVSRCQLRHHTLGHRADVMDVQLSFGETGNEVLGDRHDGQSCRLTRQRWPVPAPLPGWARDALEIPTPPVGLHNLQPEQTI